MKIAFETLGCKLNQAETEAMARQFVQAGHEVVGEVETADIYILNTCTVTGTADSKSRHLLRLAHRRNPSAVIVATGCYSERVGAELAKVEGISLVVGNEEKTNLLECLREAGLLTGSISRGKKSASLKQASSRTRAFVKIQDGCRNFCAYCIVPYVRSLETSIPGEEVVQAVRERAEEGYQEVVLTGTRVGAYSDGKTDLKGLLERLLSDTDIPRIRLSSLQPREISQGLIGLWRDKRLCPHFHLSLQSGSGSVLSRMKRRYTLQEYEQAVALIRENVPDVAITTDIIVGFPGETDKEFAESLEFCKRMEFARIHVFPYSPRTGTAAAAMPGQIADAVKKERASQMLALAKGSAAMFRAKFSGVTLDVLWEKQTGEGVWSGVTGNYIKVTKRDDRDLENKVTRVRLG